MAPGKYGLRLFCPAILPREAHAFSFGGIPHRKDDYMRRKRQDHGGMEQKMVRVALVQHGVSPDLDHNLKKALGLARKAAEAGAEIICLQELFRTPYFPQDEAGDTRAYAETVPGESTEVFSRLTEEYGTSIIVPLYEKTESGPAYNTAVAIENGRLLLPPYRKVHVPHDPLFFEKSYFHPGSQYRVFNLSRARVAVLICYDQWFPEAARIVTLMGAEIIFYPTAIGWIRGMAEPLEGDWRESWETIQRGHAIANGIHVAAANRVGIEGELEFWGSSFVSDAFGTVIARAGERDDEVLIADISLTMNELVREGWGFLNNRRPDTYGIITRKENE
jgi:agmatine deiminase